MTQPSETPADLPETTPEASDPVLPPDETSAGPVPEAPPPQPSEILEPYFAKLSVLRQQATQPNSPSQINIGERSFQVDPWEREMLLQSLEPGGSENGWRSLLVQGVALQTKSLIDVKRLAHEAVDDRRRSGHACRRR